MWTLSVDWMIKGILFLVYTVCAYKVIQIGGRPLMRRWDTPDYLAPLHEIDEDKPGPITAHLELLLRATSRNYTRQNVPQFIALSLSLFTGSYLLLLRGIGGLDFSLANLSYAKLFHPQAFLYAAIIGLLPYAIKRMRIFLMRHENSYAMIDALEQLIIHYRRPGREGDLYRALFTVTDTLQGPIKRTFHSMVTMLQVEGRTSIRRATELFEYQIQNGWAKQLSILFIKAFEDKRDIERALKKVHSDMTESRRHLEQEKSEYSESIIMGFLPTVLLPIAIFGINRMFEGAVINLLFSEPKVFQALLLCVFSSLVGLGTSFVLSKPRIEV